jgi:uncharacterized repeat protein (TIGR02543 family)
MRKILLKLTIPAVLVALAVLAGCSNPAGGGGDTVSHTVTFDVNGGDPLGEGQDTRIVNDGAAIGALPVPTRTDYGFGGWFTGADAQYSDASTVTADITLYARWVINAHTVTFAVNGGDSLGTDVTRTVSHGAAVGALPVPTRTDYGFGGWFTGEDAQYSDASIVTADITLYARWIITPPDLWDESIASSFAGGNGTPGDPYRISTAAQLAYLAQEVNGGETYTDAHFTLTNNLDLDRHEWTAIGTDYTYSFKGSFDGKNHVIYWLVINKSDTDHQGLFGFLDGAKVSNLGLEDVAIVGQSFVGGIAGYVSGNGSIENCYSTGAVSGTTVGGIAGYVFIGSIEDCYSTGTVSGSSAVGGIAGNVFIGSISGSYSTGTVSGEGDYTGGIAGYVGGGGIVENCYSTGTVSGEGSYTGGIAGYVGGNSGGGGTIDNCYSTGTVSGSNAVGGIAGFVGGNGSIENCYSTGAVSGEIWVGGIVGEVYWGGSIEYCYSTGTVSGTMEVGGIAGGVYYSSSISGSYSTGAVSGEGYAGGIVGYVGNGGIVNCAALNPTVTASSGSAGRVAGYIVYSGSGNTFTGNVAWSGMVPGGVAFTTTNINYTGTSISAVQVQYGTGLPARLRSDPWTHTPGKLPVLDGLAGQDGTLPAHLE